LASDELGRTVVQAVDYLGEGFAWILAAIIDNPRSILPSSEFETAEERLDNGAFIGGEGFDSFCE
jgi:hypothetical protein